MLSGLDGGHAIALITWGRNDWSCSKVAVKHTLGRDQIDYPLGFPPKYSSGLAIIHPLKTACTSTANFCVYVRTSALVS